MWIKKALFNSLSVISAVVKHSDLFIYIMRLHKEH